MLVVNEAETSEPKSPAPEHRPDQVDQACADATPAGPLAARPARLSALPPWLRAAVTGLGAALLFGSWATLVNRGHGWRAAATAGAVQAGLSLASTFCYSFMLEWFYRLGDSRAARLALGCGVAPAVGVAVMSGAHAVAGTKNIVATIAPSAASSVIFAVVYTLEVGLKFSAQAPKS